jgi:hypothetical protein
MISQLDWLARMKKTSQGLVKEPDIPLPNYPEMLAELVEEHEPASTLADFEGWMSGFGDHWSFRGQADSAWRLQDNLERQTTQNVSLSLGRFQHLSQQRLDPDGSKERRLLEEFKQRFRQHTKPEPADQDLVGWFAWMQHFGARTRLLDWSRSPYVALYFALGSSNAESCAVWAVDDTWLNTKTWQRLRVDPNIPSWDHRQMAARYFNSAIVSETNEPTILFTAPVALNERIKIQKGHFLCNLSRNEPFDINLFRMLMEPDPANVPVVRKLVVKRALRNQMLEKLAAMGIDRKSLFPGEDFARPLDAELQVWLEQFKDSWRKSMVAQDANIERTRHS